MQSLNELVLNIDHAHTYSSILCDFTQREAFSMPSTYPHVSFPRRRFNRFTPPLAPLLLALPGLLTFLEGAHARHHHLIAPPVREHAALVTVSTELGRPHHRQHRAQHVAHVGAEVKPRGRTLDRRLCRSDVPFAGLLAMRPTVARPNFQGTARS